jgi:sugar phosphate isomerase/epimerase
MKNAFSRRAFVRSGALMTVPFTVHGAIPAIAGVLPSSARQSAVRLGLAGYTFRNFTRAQLIGFMKQLKVADLNAKDAKDQLPMDPALEAQATAEYAAAGIALHAAGTVSFPKGDDEDIRARFQYAKRAGIKVIVAALSPATIPRVEKFVKEYDIRIAIHNHGPEDQYFPSPLDVLKAVGKMDPRIGCCIDIGHCARAGADVPSAIRAVGPRLFNLHAKDLLGFQSKESQVAVGEGIMPIREIFKSLLDINYKGFVDLEYEISPEDPMPGVLASFAYMRGVLAGMGA